MNDGPNATWLPNLVGGVSIWKLAVDLNEPKFFDGRLLVPETEGSESLPVTVRWDLANLLPLKNAREKSPAEVEAAVKDFQAALARVAKVFSTPDSGFDKYKAAFTMPSVEADDGGNYFYSAEKKKLYVINWGASPRSMAGRAEYVFGYEDWGKAFNDKSAPVGPGSVSALAASAVAGGAGPGLASAVEAAKKEDPKDDKEKEKKDDGKQRPWWMWPLFALIAIALILLALLLLKTCEEQASNKSADAGGEAGADATSADGASDGAMTGDGANEAGGDAAGAADALADAHGDAAGDAGADAASADGGKDAGKDGATASNDDEGDDDDTDSDIELGVDGKPVPGGKVTITMGGAPGGAVVGAKKAPHRRHYQADAVKWRVVSGNDRVTRTEQRGRRFDVWLAKGRTFQGVGVEWQDKSGKWHAH